MVSPERVMDYGRLKVEPSLETIPPSSAPPENWPDKGNITFNDLCYSHSTDGPVILKNISCAIKAGEKVNAVKLISDTVAWNYL